MIALLIFSVWVLLAALALALVAGGAERHTCDGDCRQGRNCSCGDRDA